MNPLIIFTSMKAKSKMTLFIVLGLVSITFIIAVAITGHMGIFLTWLFNAPVLEKKI